MDCIICRYGELALKGKNRNLFENRLVRNIKACLERNGVTAELKKVRGRIFIFTEDASALDPLTNVFGLVSISPAVVSDSLPHAIEEKVIGYVNELISDSIKTFRISSKRIDKKFPKSSGDMDILLGDAVGNRFRLKARMKGADLDIGVEIHDTTYIFHEKLPCPGGLPLGISGKVACLIEKESDIAAAWLVMRRGCSVFPVIKNNIDISNLTKYAYGEDIISSKVRDIFNINAVMEKRKCKALVTGDLFEDFSADDYKGIEGAILTPLIGYDKKQLNALLEMIS